MNSFRHIRRMASLALAFWILHGLSLLAVGTDVIHPVLRAADIARDKDVVWLSLVTAIVAMLFSAWLVRQLMVQSIATIKAINALTLELRSRRCFHKDSDIDEE